MTSPIAVIIFVWLSLSLYTIFTVHGIYKRELPELWSCSPPLQTVHLRYCVQIFFTLPPLSILIKNPYNIPCKKSRWTFILSNTCNKQKIVCMLFALNVVVLPVSIIKYSIYRICSRNLRPRVFCAPWFLKDNFGFIFAPRISRTIVLFVYQ